MITYLGLVLIVVGWGIQLLNDSRDIQKNFVLVYSLGAVLLSIDAFMGNMTILAVLNLVSFIVALAVFLKLDQRRR
jgi:membrane-bound ClpP family serine protease